MFTMTKLMKVEATKQNKVYMYVFNLLNYKKSYFKV